MLCQSSRGGGQARPDQTHYPPLQRVMIFIRRTRLSISHHPSTTITHQLSSILEQINLPPAESKPEPIDDHPPPRDLIVPLDPIWSMTVPPTNRVPRLACTYFGTWLGRWCIVYFLRINLDPFQIIGSDYIIPKSVRCLRSGFMSLSEDGEWGPAKGYVSLPSLLWCLQSVARFSENPLTLLLFSQLFRPYPSHDINYIVVVSAAIHHHLKWPTKTRTRLHRDTLRTRNELKCARLRFKVCASLQSN